MTSVGHSLQFDGTNQYMEIPHTESIDLGNEGFSVTMQFYVDSLNGDVKFLTGKNYVAEEPWWGLVFFCDERRLAFYIDDGTNWAAADAEIDVDVEQWYTATAVRNVGEGLRLYVNGTEGVENDGTGTIGDVESLSNIFIAARPDLNANRFFQGKIAYYALWDRPLTRSEANQLWVNPNQIFRNEDKDGAKKALLHLTEALSEGDWDLGSSIADDSWHHVAVTRDADADKVEVFIDGASKGVKSIDASELTISPDGLLIGAEQDAVGTDFDVNQQYQGQMDEFIVYNRVLSQEEIDTLYNNGELSTADYSYAYAHSPELDGGIVAGGTADETMVHNPESYLDYAGTTVLTGGEAGVNFNESINGDGGAVQPDIPPLIASLSYFVIYDAADSLEGGTFGGEAQMSSSADEEGSGGAVASGESTPIVTRDETSEDGVLLSGEAHEETPGRIFEVGNGGAVISGSIDIVSSTTAIPDGGAVSGGITEHTHIQENDTSGGLLANGQAGTGLSLSGQGGAVASGDVGVLIAYDSSGEGGALASGEAWEFVGVPIGGQVNAGGEATVEVEGDRYWVGDGTSTNWNTTDNWSSTDGGPSGASVPTLEYAVYFNGNGLGDCLMEVDAFAASMDLNSAYSGNFDSSTSDVQIAGDFLVGGSNFDLGDGTWTVGGNWTIGDDITDGDSLVVLTGDSTIDTGHNNRTIHSLRVENKLDYSMVSSLVVDGTLDVDGTLNLNSGTILVGRADSSGDLPKLKARDNSVITGNGTFKYEYAVEDMEVGSGVTWDNPIVWFFGCTTTIPARTWSNGQVTIEGDGTSTVYSFANGSHEFLGNVLLSASSDGTYNMDGDLVCHGNITISAKGSDPVYNKGDGQIKFHGGNAQTANFNDSTVEDIWVYKSGNTLQFTSGVTADSLIVDWGNVDFNGQDITTTGNFEIREQGVMDKTNLAGTDIVVGGNGTLRGRPGDIMDIDTATDWTLTISGDARAYWVNAGNSDAHLGSTVYAYNSTDAYDNQNWWFNAVVNEPEVGGGVEVAAIYSAESLVHIYETAECGPDFKCKIPNSDEFCIIDTRFRNLGSMIFNREQELTPKERCGSNTENVSSECTVASLSPIILCRRERELQEEEALAEQPQNLVKKVERPKKTIQAI